MKRTVSWILLMIAAALAMAACGDECEVERASISGDAIPFNISPDARIPCAEISILEHPEMRMTTGEDGHFHFDGLEVGEEVTLRLEHPDYHPVQTATITLGPEGAERVTFQAVDYLTYYGMALYVLVIPDEENCCQMVTTVTRVGKSLYDPGAHGEEGAYVTLDPPLPADYGPIYFDSSVMPNFGQTESSDDGGVLFLNVPPGEYVWTAHKPGVEFRPVKMKCRAGWLVNASPPWGLQALE
ncbi:carboxypeptidase-like regulatory domain-containing protein [Thermodesulfobacteriota bacterium]